MKKISNEEFDKLPLMRKGSSTEFYARLMALAVGDEPLVLYKREWRPGYPPTTIVNRIERKFNRLYERKNPIDEPGWAFRRVK